MNIRAAGQAVLVAGALLWFGTASAAGMRISQNAYGQMRTITLRVDDLNLATRAGAEELLSRLHYAAMLVCDADAPYGGIKLYEFRRKCVNDTMRRSVAGVGSLEVARLYEADMHEGQ